MSRAGPAALALAAALDAARLRDGYPAFIGRLQLYCNNGACTVREVNVEVKEYDGPTPARLTCPACRRPLTLHGVQTLNEIIEEGDRDARLSVREQLQLARREAAGDISGFRILSFDESLPRAEECLD
jgi:hypothetical protein